MPYLRKEEIKMLLDVIPVTEHKTAIMLGLDLGCRAGEIIKIPNVPEFEKNIDVLDSKSEKAEKKNREPFRSCAISQATLTQIETFQKELKKAGDKRKLLFPYTPKTMTRWIQLYCNKAGIKRNKGKIRWHMLRHTFIQQCLDHDIPIKQISEQTGDSIYTLLKHYSNYTMDDRIKAIEKMGLV